MSRLFELIKKNKQILMYLIFGVLTTAVNVVAYWAFAHPVALNTELSTALAWVVSVIFAFVTNKLFVFESKASASRTLIYETVTFFGSRVLTGLLDVGIMYLFVTVLSVNDLVMKVASNIIVIVLNYVLSKLIVFKSRGGEADD